MIQHAMQRVWGVCEERGALSNQRRHIHSFTLSGRAQLSDFHHKMRKTGRHCEAAQPTKQSMFIIALRSSGLLPAAFRAVAMTIIYDNCHRSCVSPVYNLTQIFMPS
jgi:hypothetical protein